jgi:cytochrome c-type biogenesis protein CcmE
MVIGIIGGVAVAAGFALKAWESSIGYKDPTQVITEAVPEGKRFQLGGMVKAGSVERVSGSLLVCFVVTDKQNDLPVLYDKVLPDLFKENSGVVANGRLDASGVFVADEVLAKHVENYMPPAVDRSLKKGESRLEGAAVVTRPTCAEASRK